MISERFLCAVLLTAALCGCQDTAYNSASELAEDDGADVSAPEEDAEAPEPDTAPQEDAPIMEDAPEPEVDCSTLSQTDCLTHGDCVLELGPVPDGYVCRPSNNTCERQIDEALCTVLEGCAWFPGGCYCPEGLVCGCGGGPPPICRQIGTPELCRAPGQSFCQGEGAQCCAPEGESLGVCLGPDEVCGGDPALRLVSLEVRGGLCQDGPCFTNLQIQQDGSLSVDNERPDPPILDTLDDEVLDELRALLVRIDTDDLDEGYGPCCEADSDGSDNYITFYDEGEPTREVRISSGPLPIDLEALEDLLEREAYSRLNEP